MGTSLVVTFFIALALLVELVAGGRAKSALLSRASTEVPLKQWPNFQSKCPMESRTWMAAMPPFGLVPFFSHRGNLWQRKSPLACLYKKKIKLKARARPSMPLGDGGALALPLFGVAVRIGGQTLAAWLSLSCGVECVQAPSLVNDIPPVATQCALVNGDLLAVEHVVVCGPRTVESVPEQLTAMLLTVTSCWSSLSRYAVRERHDTCDMTHHIQKGIMCSAFLAGGKGTQRSHVRSSCTESGDGRRGEEATNSG